MKKLFVYGTLQQGYGNNVYLRGANLLGKGLTKKNYTLYNCGFPFAVPSDKDGLPVMGEVWEVEAHHISSCDSLEGHPDWYVRTPVQVLVDGVFHNVEIYEMPCLDDTRGLDLCKTYNNKYYYWSR